jgi:hypothetical protein
VIFRFFKVLSGVFVIFRFFEVWSGVANQMTCPIASCAAGTGTRHCLRKKPRNAYLRIRMG